jgi:hypothetical protein
MAIFLTSVLLGIGATGFRSAGVVVLLGIGVLCVWVFASLLNLHFDFQMLALSLLGYNCAIGAVISGSAILTPAHGR